LTNPAFGRGLFWLIKAAHAMVALQLPTDHKDPFDRILVAQSQVEAALLLTDDPKTRAFGVQTFW